MRKNSYVAFAIIAAAGLSACSPNARDKTAEAGDAIGADVHATTSNAAAATDHAADRTGDHLANAGATIGSGADKAGSAIADGADKTGDAIANGADRAKNATGNVLVSAGQKLKD